MTSAARLTGGRETRRDAMRRDFAHSLVLLIRSHARLLAVCYIVSRGSHMQCVCVCVCEREDHVELSLQIHLKDTVCARILRYRAITHTHTHTHSHYVLELKHSC